MLNSHEEETQIAQKLAAAKEEFVKFTTISKPDEESVLKGWQLYQKWSDIRHKYNEEDLVCVAEVLKALTTNEPVNKTLAQVGLLGFMSDTGFRSQLLEGLNDDKLQKADEFCNAMYGAGWKKILK